MYWASNGQAVLQATKIKLCLVVLKVHRENSSDLTERRPKEFQC